MLIWHNVWMASHGRELAANVKRVGEAVWTGSKSVAALGAVCAIAVMREGSEIALFMYGLVAWLERGRTLDRLASWTRRWPRSARTRNLGRSKQQALPDAECPDLEC
jgi:high-affinity Fe2+/Pb2+ permease